MSLFNKYLSIIQEANYNKTKERSGGKLSVQFDPDKFERELSYPKTYEFKGDEYSNLSDEEIQKKEIERQKKVFDTIIQNVDPDEKYNKMKEDQIDSQILSGKLQVGNYSFTSNQKRIIFSDPDLAYTYALHFKDNIKNKDFNNFISKEDVKKIENTIVKDYSLSNLYAKKVLDIPVNEFIKNKKRGF
jgi:hypothetical protein